MIELNNAWSTAIISWRMTSCDARWLRSYHSIFFLAYLNLEAGVHRLIGTIHTEYISSYMPDTLVSSLGLILHIYIVMRKLA